jgi:hypothetical protein
MADTDTEETEEPWGPDPRWAYPAVFTLTVWAIGWAPRIAAHDGGGFSPWLMAVVGVAAAILGYARAGRAYPRDEYGVGLAEHASLLAIVNGAAVGAWLVWAGLTSPWQAIGLLAVLAAVCGSWFAMILTLAPRRYDAEMERQQAMMAADEDQVTRMILNRAGRDDVRMYGTTPHRGGYTVEIGPDPDVDDPPSYNDMVRSRDKLTTHLAIYWRRKNGTKIREQDVNIEKLEADRWLLHVSTNHVLEKTVPFHPDTSNNGRPPSFNDALLLGLFEDGAEMRAKLCGRHCKTVGATGGGKSVFLNNVIGRTLECRAPDGRPDAMVMVAATDKLIPLVYNWLVPWLSGERAQPAIAWVAGQAREDVNNFLVAMYDLARDRNSRLSRKTKHVASPDTPGIVVILEEATLLTGIGYGPIQMHADGDEHEMWWSASRLINEFLAIARSAGMSVFVATQIGLVDALGDFGTQMMRNLTLRACLLTMTPHDGQATLPALPATVNTNELEHNSMYLQVGIGEKSRAMPGKAGKLDEEDVIPVALNVSREVATLSERDIDAIGRELWESRWDIEHHDDLSRAAAEDTEAPGGRGYAWPGRPAPVRPAQPVPQPPPVVEAEPGPAPAAAGGAPTVVMDDPTPAPPPARPDPQQPVAEPVGGWTADWDAELARMMGGGDTTTPPTPPAGPTGDAAGPPPVDPDEKLGPYGLPGQAAQDRIRWWAEQCKREADEAEQLRNQGLADALGGVPGGDDGDGGGGGGDEGPGDDGPGDDDPYRDNPVTGWCKRLPEPLRSVVAYIDEHRIGGVEFVPSAELAEVAFGADVVDGAVRLGQALARNVPGLRALPNAKSYPAARGRPAGRGRGFYAADLRRAADAYLDGKDLRSA